MDVASGSGFDPLAAKAESIQQHPQFAQAFRHYIETMLDWRALNKAAAKASASHARSTIVGYVLYLHFAADPADPDDGPGYAKLLRLCVQRRDCGPRVLKTVLALLRLTGFVRLERGMRDKRLKLYRPTAKMIGFMQDWYSRSVGSFDKLNPNNDFGRRLRRDEALLGHIITAIAPPYMDNNIQLVGHFPALFELFAFDAGFPVAALMVQSHLNQVPMPSATAIAKRFGLSPSQIRVILKMLEDRKLTISAGSKDPAALQLLFEAYVARELSLYATYALQDSALDELS
jgi:hypothetical protein